MRKLATIRKISSISPIKGKDRVEMAAVDGWTCMVSKADNFKEGSLCVFCEPDSVFPQTEQWGFLKKYNYRIKTQTFRDSDKNPVYSQGLALPLDVLPKTLKVTEGLDVTDILGITQYEPPTDKDSETVVKKGYKKVFERLPLMRYSWYRSLIKPKKSTAFPSFVNKTDEERIQNCPEILDTETIWVATEKIDGQSGTFAVVRHRHLLWSTYEFMVCSRNYRKPVPDNSSYWHVAKKYNIEQRLKRFMKKHPDLEWVAIQGECIAPGVQGNKYHVRSAELLVFNLINSKKGRLPSYYASSVISEELHLTFVPLLGFYSLQDKSVGDILAMSNGNSKLYDTLREGIVFRSEDGKKSFKAVSPEFLIKYGE